MLYTLRYQLNLAEFFGEWKNDDTNSTDSMPISSVKVKLLSWSHVTKALNPSPMLKPMVTLCAVAMFTAQAKTEHV